MDDDRIWDFEQSLWTGDAANYREKISQHCLMALPAPPYVLRGDEAIAAVSDTPRWQQAIFSDRRVSRPQHGTIVIAYEVAADREGGEPYSAHCTTVMHLEGDHDWKVIQHQQTPKPVIG